MSQLFIARGLEQLLQYWEDCNLSGEFNFQLGLLTKGVKNNEADLGALIGTELNRIGLLARSIPEYQNLRKVLAGTHSAQLSKFLPRIPKEMREIFNGNYDLFTDHDFVKTPIRIPQHLLQWNETRRACIVEDNIPLPVIDLRKENWLTKLPYDSFFLKLSSPFIFPDPESNREWSMENFLVYKENGYVRIMAWPKEMEVFLFTETERKKMQEGINLLKKKKAPTHAVVSIMSKVNDWFISNLAVLDGTSLVRSVQGVDAEVRHSDLYDSNAWTEAGQTIPDLYAKLRVMIEMVNGFCKLMATLPPKPTVKILDQGSLNQTSNPPRQWFELPLQTVEYFHTTTENEIVVIKAGSGSEKSPHVRKGHNRRLVKKDGTIQDVWIESFTVRADKLSTEQLQGGATKII